MTCFTHYGEMEVICENCKTEKYMLFLTNKDNLKCDKCNNISNKVTYKFIDFLGKKQ